MKKLLFVALLMLGCTSCATIFCGSKDRITFDSDHKAPVTAFVDGYRHKNITFPFSIKVKRGLQDTEVRFISDGYYSENIIVGE